MKKKKKNPLIASRAQKPHVVTLKRRCLGGGPAPSVTQASLPGFPHPRRKAGAERVTQGRQPGRSPALFSAAPVLPGAEVVAAGTGRLHPGQGWRRGEACPSGSSVAACAHLQGLGRTPSAFILNQVGCTALPLTVWQHLSGCFLKGIPCLCLPDSVRCKNDGVSLSASKTYRNMWKRSIFQIENHVQ